MKRVAGLLLLLVAASLQAAEPGLQFGQEIPLDVTTTGAYGVESRELQAIASDGVDFFAVWFETHGDYPDQTGSLRGTRIFRDGTIERPEGRVLIDGWAAANSAQIQWSGSGYLLLWSDGRTVSSARMTPDGAVGLQQTVTEGSYARLYPFAAGAFTAMVVRDHRWDRVRLDESGRLIGGPTPFPGTLPQAFGGDGFLSLSSDGKNLNAERLGGDCRWLSTSRVDKSAIAQAAGFDGRDYVGVWFGSTAMMTSRITTGGTIAPPVAAVPRQYELRPGNIVVTPLGENMLVLYEDWSYDQCLCCFSACPPPPNIYYAQLVGGDGKGVGDAIAIHDEVTHHDPPMVASNGESVLVAWSEDVLYGMDIKLLLLSPGQKPDPRNIVRLARVDGRGSVDSADAASNGKNVLVAWQEYGGEFVRGKAVVRFALFDWHGRAITPIATLRGGSPRVVRDGADGYLLAWRSGPALLAQRISAAGDAGHTLTIEPQSDYYWTVTASPDRILFLSSGTVLRARILAPNDTLRVSDPLPGDPSRGWSIAAAWSGNRFVVSQGATLITLGEDAKIWNVSRFEYEVSMLTSGENGALLSQYSRHLMLDAMGRQTRALADAQAEPWQGGVWTGRRWLLWTDRYWAPGFGGWNWLSGMRLVSMSETTPVTAFDEDTNLHIIAAATGGDGTGALVVSRTMFGAPFDGARRLSLVPFRDPYTPRIRAARH